MQEYRIFFLYSNDNKIDFNRFKKSVDEFIKNNGLPPLKSQMNDIRVLYGSDEYWKIKKLSDDSQKYGIKIVEHTYEVHYNKSEISNAMFFELKLGIFGREDYTKSFSTEYTDFYCESCDTHQYIPKNDVYINKTEFRGKDIATSMNCNNEIIVSNKMKKLIEEAKLTGVEFYSAHHYNNRIKNDYSAWHMSVTSIMPPIDKSMPVFIIENYCHLCKKHHILPLSYVRYKHEELEKSSDFNLSCETFGPGWYGSPKLIISRNVFDLIKQNKIKGCRFEIVGSV